MRAATVVFLVLFLATPALTGERDTFAILSEDATETSRVVSVRISRRMSSDDLVRLAGIVKATKASPTLRNTVVSFYLPAMPQNQRPWASVDLAPTPKVHIAGLRLEDQNAYAASANADTRHLTGAWLVELPAPPGRIAIFTERGRVYLETATRGGAKTVEEVIEAVDQRGRRFELKQGGEDFYLLKPSGEMELRTADRLMAVAEPIALDRNAKDSVATARPSEASPEHASTGTTETTEEPSSVSTAISFALPSPSVASQVADDADDATMTAPPAQMSVVTSLPAVRKKRVVRRVPSARASDTVMHDVMNIRYR